jgi:hypothetical protein
MSGGAQAKVNHPTCTARGDLRCEFAIRWATAKHLATRPESAEKPD